MRYSVSATIVIGLALCALTPAPVSAFGQNKINYNQFDWQVYHGPHFDVYYYPEEAAFVQQMVSFTESAYLQLSKSLDHELTVRVPFIYFKTHGEFEQTNITLSFIPEGVGAFAEPIENRMVLPIDVPPDELYALVVHELTHIFEYSILFEGQLRRAFRANPPLWLMEGLAEHFARRNDPLDIMVIRDAVVNNIVPPITQVNSLSFLTYRFGEAAFDFIGEQYGDEGIRNFLFEYRKSLLTNNIGKAIKDAFGVEPEEFDRLFQRYLRKRFLPILLEKKEAQDYGREIGSKKESVFTFAPTLSPSGDLLAVLSTQHEDLDVLVLSARDGEVIRNLTPGFTNDYDSIVTVVFRGQSDLSWSPAGDDVAFIARRENRRVLYVINALTGKQVLEKVLPLDQASSPAYSPDGKELLLTGNLGGVVDIYKFNFASGEIVNLTKDEFYDGNARWSPDGKAVVYNRRINNYAKIFMVDVSDPDLKTQLTFGEHRDLQPSFSADGKEIYFSSDGNPERIFNIYSLSLESGEISKWTDVVGGNFTPLEIDRSGGTRTVAITTFSRGRFRLFRLNLEQPLETVRPEDKGYEPVEVVPFEPPLKLTLDDSQKGSYDKLKWHFEGNPDVAIGIADDGTVLTNAQVVFTDLFGDHRIEGLFYSISTFSNFDFRYYDFKRRWDWWTQVIDYRDYYTVFDGFEGQRVNKARSVTGAQAGLIYPFDRYHRIAGSFGVFQRDLELPQYQDVDGNGTLELAGFEGFSGTYPAITGTFTGDTVRFKPDVGPWHGRRYDLTVAWAPVSSGDFGAFTNYFIDWRNYQRMTSRSTFVARGFMAISTGETGNGVSSSDVFSIGGFNQIRGYEFREFFGDRAWFANLELRFPLFDAIIVQKGFGIPSIQGIIFFDMGAAYYRGGLVFDENLFTPVIGGFVQTGGLRRYEFYGKRDVYNRDNGTTEERTGLIDGRASYGFGFNFYFGQILLNWSFAHRLPFLETVPDPVNGPPGFVFVEEKPGGYRSSFYIGTRF
jgi:WD40 repeat protein